MHKFGALYFFNLRAHLRNWMVWFVALLLLAGIAALFWYFSQHPTSEASVPSDTPASGEAVGNVVLFSTYIITLMCGGVITASVASERVNGVGKLLEYRVHPLSLVYSKVISLFSLVTVLIAVLVAEIATILAYSPSSAQLWTSIVDQMQIAPSRAWLVALFAVLAIMFYTALYALVGVYVRSNSQMQFAQLPVTVPLLITIGVSFAVNAEPTSPLGNWAEMAPFTGPFVTMLRTAAGHISYPELWISLAAIVVWISLINFWLAAALSPRLRARTLNLLTRTPVTDHHR